VLTALAAVGAGARVPTKSESREMPISIPRRRPQLNIAESGFPGPGTVVIGRYEPRASGRSASDRLLLEPCLGPALARVQLAGQSLCASVMPSPAILMCGWPLPSARRFFRSPSILRRLPPSCRLFLPIEPVGRRHHGIDSLGWSLFVPSIGMHIRHADGHVVPIVCRFFAADPISRPEIT
jgi:hypothetical protein